MGVDNVILTVKEGLDMKDKVVATKIADGKDVTKVVLNSRNSQAVRELMDKLSIQLMEKNRKLYERLAYK